MAKKKQPFNINGHEPGSFGCHEVLHMASFLQMSVYHELIVHPAIKNNKEWLKLAHKAQGALADLYNAIGLKHL